MDKILSFEQFMTLCAGFFVVGSAIALFFPDWYWYVLGISFNNREAIFLVRAQAPWALSMGILGFLLKERDVSESDARAYLWSVLVGCILALILAFRGSTNGILSGFGWFAVVAFLSLGLGCAYFLHVDED